MGLPVLVHVVAWLKAVLPVALSLASLGLKNMSSQYPVLKLNKNEERRIRAGHLWVFSNEVNVQETPFDQLVLNALRRGGLLA